MKGKAMAVFILSSILLGIGGCNQDETLGTPTANEQQTATPALAAPKPTETAVAVPKPTPVEGKAITAEAPVDTVEILLLESFSIQVRVMARGNLPDSCTEIDEITQTRTGDTFHIAITTSRPPDQMCAAMLKPFEETVALDVAGLPAGVYKVTVNGVSGSFEFSVDNIVTQDEQVPEENLPRFEDAPCPFNSPRGMTIECGFIIVPEDHADPAGPTIRLAVAILKNRSTKRLPDPVILLSGGPGEKTVANVPTLAQILVTAVPDRDIIFFDQRGVGLSEPALDCPEWEQAQFDVLDEADIETAGQITFDALMACRDRLVSAGYNLAAYNTIQSAADVNAIRVALGYDQLNLYGGSYGSLLAQAVVRDHPEGIRSVVLWSVLPLEKSIFVDSSTSTANAVIHLLNACATDTACNSAYPDLQTVLFEVIERLNTKPLAFTVTNPLDGKQHDAVLTGNGVFGNLVLFLYQTPIIPLLPQTIYDVYNGDYGLMTQLRGQNLAFLSLMSRGMEFSVVCTDDLIGQTPQEYLDLLASIPIPLEGPANLERAIEYGIFGICENWPVEEAEPWVKEPLVSDIPTLILEGEFDPVTPSEYGRLVAANLSNSFFFEFPGVGHNIIIDQCARNIAGAFLDDPYHAPDASCIAQLGIRFATSYEAPEGRFSLPLFSDWSVEEAGGYVMLRSPQDEITVTALAIQADGLKEASLAAWEMIDPEFDAEPTVSERPCTGCAASDAEKFAVIGYDTGNSDSFVMGFGWLHAGTVYLEIWQTTPALMEQKAPQWEILVSGFTISALESVDPD